MMEYTTPGQYWYHLNKLLIFNFIIYLLVCLRTEAAPSQSNLLSRKSSIHNNTLNERQVLDWNTLLGGDNSFNTLALRTRQRNSVRTSTRDRDLLLYDQLWRAHLSDYSQTQSKIEVLGQVLKRRVATLRQVANSQVELVFLVDSSASVGLENFFNELKFVKKLLADFTVAMWATRVAVITFSSSHRVVANVDQISVPDSDQHKCSLLNEDLPRITYVGGGTFTKGALELAEAVLSDARPDATKAVFLVTDGYSNGGNPLPHALALRRSGVEIFTFGIRDGNVQELLSMSSHPQNEHCYIVDNFTEFEALARRALHEDLQVGDFLPENRDRCSSLCTEQSECCDVSATCRCGTHTGQYECVCPPGMYGNGLKGGCRPCPSGTFKPESLPGGVSTCHPCPDPNQVTPPGSTIVTECRCNVGFKTMEEAKRCEEVRCQQLQPPSNGVFVAGECSNTVNSACAMRCNPGHELVGSSIRLCNETGLWTGQETRCLVKTCQPLPTPSHAVLECDPPDLSVDSVCSIRCNIGYTLLGSVSRRCLPIAQWSGLPNACRAITCPPLPTLTFGFYSNMDCTEQKLYYGTICRAQCVQGFILEGATNRQCLATGKWEETPDTKCVDVTPPIISCPDDITIETAPNKDARNVTWDMPKVGDNSGEEPAIAVIPAIKSPWNIRIGTVTLKYIATDNMGNTADCRFRITVVDAQPPVISRCRSPDPILTSENTTEVSWEIPQFSDNSGFPVIVYKSHEPGTVMPLGVTEVEYLAMDDAGNTKRCLIYIRVQKNPCVVPNNPENGQITCMSSEMGLLVCTMSCKRGYGFAIAPSPVYHCDQNGIWYPQQQLPLTDCSAQDAANTGVKAVQLELRTDECNQELLEEYERSLTRELGTKVMQYCSHSVRCRLEHLSVRCNDRNANSLGPQGLHARSDVSSGSPIGPQGLHARSDSGSHRGGLHTRTGISSGADVTSTKYSEFRRNSPPNVVVDLNVTAYIRPGRGDAISGPPEVIQEHLMNSLSSVPITLFEDLSQGQIDLGMRTQRSGAEGKVGTLMSMDSLPSQLVCRPGATLVNGTLCVQCSRGMFYNSVTSDCELCPVGMYQDGIGHSECKMCPDGFSTLTPSAKSVDSCKELCSAGTYSTSGMEQCEGCPRGSYQPHRGMMECIACPRDTSTPKTGSITELECAVPCAAGHVSRSGFLPCLPCPVGYFQPTAGLTSCMQCPHQAITRDEGASSVQQCQGLRETDYKLDNDTDLPTVFYNECFSAPCQNDGDCYIVPSGYLCSCKSGFTGANCEENINECLVDSCHNNATCVDLVNDFRCVCPPGFIGNTCAMDIDECLSQPCQHNSTCIDGPDNYQCQCTKGYQGADCDTEINECNSAPCHNGGQCIDFIGGYLCACLTGFHGDQCDDDLDECTSQPCYNNGSCHDHPGYYSCSCQPGFNGYQCEIDIDECTSSPCQHAGQCVDGSNGFMCHCLPGFSGNLCEKELPWNFSLVFEHSGTTDYVLLESILPDLSEVTVAFWMQTTDSANYGCPFSYATSDVVDNALTLMDYTGFALYINGETVVTDVTGNDGLWHHIVVTWSNHHGDWRIYKDGQEEAMGTDLATGTTIEGGGVFVIGQEQDILGGDFNLVESFLGEISLLNIWDRVLDKQEVRALHRSCDKQTDVIQAWPNFLAGITGRVLKVENHFCQGCFSPLPPRNGNFTGFKPNTTLSAVTYSCNTGFELSKGPSEAVCQVSGEWMPSHLPYCQRILCGRPANIDNGMIYVDTYMYGDFVSYRCATNYTLLGPRIRQCQASGLWSAYSPVCKKTSCGLRDIDHARIVGDISVGGAVLPGISVQYICLPGYEMTGRSNVTCKPNGRWTSHPECRPIRCPRPHIISDGYIQAAVSLTVGNSITYHCIAGYHLIGYNQRTCMATGGWGGVEPRCEPVSCGEPPEVKYATRSGSKFTFSHSVSYMCDGGYVQSGAVTITCMDTGSWSEHPVCIPLACPPLPVFHHGNIIGQQFFFGQSVQFQCDFGYVLRGAGELACTEYGRWSAPPPICVPVSCGRPDAVQYGNYYGHQFNLGDTVNYICRSGYNLIGAKQRICEGSGQWSGSPPRCQPVICPQPKRIPHSRLTQSLEIIFTYGTLIVYQCVEGYQMRDIEGGIMLCQSDGEWRGLWPTCDKISCGSLPGIAHGTFSASGNNYEDTVLYECDSGYKLQGIALQSCHANASWSGEQPQCHPIVCVAPPTVQHTNISGELYYTRKIIYTCESGYDIVGDRALKCEADGSWSGQVPRCEPVSCGSPPSVSQSRILGTDLTFNANVSYKCFAGYSLVNNDVLTCSELGVWIGDIPECVLISCGPPPDLPHGTHQGAQATYNSIVHYECDVGYRQIGGTHVTCSKTGDWVGDLPQCEGVICSEPPDVQFSDIIGLDFRFNQTISYQCWTGYKKIGNGTLVCAESDFWSGEIPECRIIVCERPPDILNAEVIGSNRTYGSDVKYQCHAGYVLIGNSDTLTCSENERWVGNVPRCDPLTCVAPPVIQHGSVFGDDLTYNKTISYVCDIGYTSVWNSTLRCSEDGTWEGDLMTCNRIVCPPPPSVLHSNIIGTDYTFNKTVAYSCDYGYYSIGDVILRCSGSAEWIGNITECKAVACEAPHVVDFAVLTVKSLTFRSNVTYSCIAGYSLLGSSVLYCSVNGTWNGSSPRCEPVTCGSPPIYPNSNFTGSEYTYNKTVLYHCDYGYEFSTGESTIMKCVENGTWSGDIPQCTPVSCGSPISIDHGYTIGNTHTYGNIVQFNCNLGYDIYGSNTATCSGDGSWWFESTQPYCIPIQCGPPPTVLHATWNETETVFNATVIYECMEGYNMNGPAQIVCHLDRTWHGKMPECLPVMCQEPVTPKNGGYVGSQFTYTSVVEYFCSQGYTLKGDTLRSCQSNGTWSGQQPECQPIDCGTPLPQQHAYPVGSFITTLGSKINYQCHEGFVSEMATSLYCTVDGVWMGERYPCQPIRCGMPLYLEHGDFTGDDYSFKSTVHYSCNQGYIMTGSPKATCQANGNWSSTQSRCEPVTCPTLNIPNHGLLNSSQFYYPMSIKVSCNVGYILQGDAVVTCMENGDWNIGIPECVPVTCRMPDGIPHGSRTFSDVVFGADVLYDCNIGFRLQGAAVRDCLANGSWSGDPPVCKRISCGTPQNITNGTVSQMEVFYGDFVSYACDEGFRLVGEPESSCAADGSFSSVPLCLVISCGTPFQIQNGHFQFVESIFKSVGVYFCDVGYNLVGEYVVYCLSNGTWSIPTARCERLSCGLPDDIENGWLELKNNNISYLANVTYNCNAGYDMIGSEISTCLATGYWSPDVPSCRPVSCGAPPELPNGDYASNDTTYGSTATYKCHHGYYLTGDDSRLCLADQTWSFTPQSCTPVSCGKPDIPHGSFQGFNWTYDASVVYVCDSGYEMSGLSNMITCGAEGVWLSDPPICERVQCDIPKAPMNGNVYANASYRYESLIEYGCDPGYELVGNALQTCLSDGDWSEVLPQCLPVSCGEPPGILNGSVIGNQGNDTFGTIVMYTCDVGFELGNDGEDFTRCGENGEWSTSLARCEPVTCGYLKSPINGDVEITEITYTSKAHYSCLKGFDLTGVKIRRCMADGTWSGRPPRCEPVVCGVPPSVSYASWEKNGYDGEEDFKYGVAVHYTCVDGYELVNDGIAFCRADGTWNVTEQSVCQIVSCGAPTPIPNGKFDGAAYTFMSVITYQCQKGYELIRSRNARCNSDGKWSEAPPLCNLITCPLVDAPIHGSVSGTNNYNDLLTFGCSSTHELIGEKQIQCNENGNWNHPAPVCKLRTCDQPSDLENGIMFGQRFLKGDVVSYRCYSGYFLEGSQSRRCQDNYLWSGDPPRCVGLDSFAAVNHHPVCILPCLHGGTCIGPYQCSCPYGYTGYRCEQVVCTNHCIRGTMCTGRHSQCPCEPHSIAQQCLLHRS